MLRVKNDFLRLVCLNLAQWMATWQLATATTKIGQPSLSRQRQNERAPNNRNAICNFMSLTNPPNKNQILHSALLMSCLKLFFLRLSAEERYLIATVRGADAAMQQIQNKANIRLSSVNMCVRNYFQQVRFQTGYCNFHKVDDIAIFPVQIRPSKSTEF